MLHRLCRFIFYKVMGWKLLGTFPEVAKCVTIVIPHTHWLDFPLGLIVRKVINKEMHYIGKKGLFKPPFGWFFRWTGGIPVDRNRNTNMVDAVVQIFNKKEVFRFTLAPEGTRKKVKNLKTGFYYIAYKANVPIVMCAFDFGNKAVKLAEPFYPSGNLIEDMPKIEAFFAEVKGRVEEYSFG